MLTFGARFLGLPKRKFLKSARHIFLMLIGLHAVVAGAQESQPSTYEGFEGRKVFKVDIAASPVMNVNVFLPLIKQKEGEPFSMAAIRDSVAALQQTLSRLEDFVSLNLP